jgi:hypothetical protein
MPVVALLALATTACAGGEPPEVRNLQITTAPVVRGQQANGSFILSDPDGLGDMDLSARLISPVSLDIPFAQPPLSDRDTTMEVAFALILSSVAPTGAYRLAVQATDVDGMESEEAVVDFDVQ